MEYGNDYLDEHNVFDRAGGNGYNEFDIMDPVERFKSQVNGIARNLNGYETIRGISLNDVTYLLDMVRNLPKPEHKNAACYVLGYIATNGGRNISVPQVTYVFQKVLPYIDSSKKVKKPDIVRYARLWMDLAKTSIY